MTRFKANDHVIVETYHNGTIYGVIAFYQEDGDGMYAFMLLTEDGQQIHLSNHDVANMRVNPNPSMGDFDPAANGFAFQTIDGAKFKKIALATLLFVFCALIYAVTGIVAGWVGLDSYMGPWIATAIIGVSLYMRFTLPITISAFFGLVYVWQWPWYVGVVFCFPGLFIAAPAMLMAAYHRVKTKLK